MLDARFDKDALGNRFRNGIMVVNANVYRVSRPSPMDRGGAVSRLGNRPDIDRTDLVGVRLCQDCLNHILGSRDIDFPCSLGIVISGRRNHPTDVEDVIGPRRATKNIVVVRQVAPDNTYAVHLLIGCQLFLIDFAGTSQQGNIEAVAPLDKFLQSGPAHGAGRAGEEYSLFCFHLLLL